MTLYQALNIDLRIPELISIVGAGGKTSTLFTLAYELKACGKRVLATTTTNIAFSEASLADRVVIDTSKNPCPPPTIDPGTIVCLGGGMVNEIGKFKGVGRDRVSEIYQRHLFDYVLVEADGSKRKPGAPCRTQ